MQFDDDTLRFPKDVRIEDIILVQHTRQGVSLINIFAELNLYEDMWSNTLSGDVTLVDGTNLPMNADITGQDKIFFSFYTPGPNPQKISLVMSLYKISERTIENDKKQVYTLHFASTEMIYDTIRKVSHAFEGYQHDWIQSLVKQPWSLNSLRNIEFDQTKFETFCVIPRWNPMKAINWITQRSVCADNNMPDMMFWETVDGFKFKSINKMMQEDIKENYIYRPYGQNSLQIGRENYRDLRQDFINIDALNIKAGSNIIEMIEQGTFAQKMMRFDISTGQYIIDEFNYNTQYDKAPNHLGTGKLIQTTPNLDEIKLFEEPDSFISVVPEHSWLFREDTKDTKNYASWLMWRRSLMMQYNAVRVQFIVPGDTSRRTGDVIEMYIPSLEAFEEDQYIPDKYYSGRYMIAAIRHHVQRDKHQMIIEAFKDGLNEPLSDENVQPISYSPTLA